MSIYPLFKKYFTPFLFFACIVLSKAASAQTACWGPVIVYTGGGTAPSITGYVDTVWAKAPVNAITKTVNLTLQPDYSAQWRAMYDGSYLYVLIEIKDASLNANPVGGTSQWNYDAAEIYIDATNSKTGSYNYATSSTVHQYGFTWGNPSTYGSPATGISYAIPTVNGGYNLAVKIPWSTIGISAPSSSGGTAIGFDINIQDNDGGSTRAATSGWYSSSSQGQEFNNASFFGTVLTSSCTSVNTAVNGANFWNINGNSGTTAGTNFIGTKDAQNLVVKVNGTQVLVHDQHSNLIENNCSADVASGFNYATALGYQTSALGWSSFTSGNLSYASAGQSTAMGNQDSAKGFGSFAIGSVNNAIGRTAVATGSTTTASGDQSTAMGNGTKALGFGSFAGGSLTTAGYDEAVALGYQTQAYGLRAFAMGDNVSAPSYAEVAIGAYNTTYTPGSVTGIYTADRIFSIGNGTSTTRSNALTILKNGRTGIGVTIPSHLFEVNGTVGFTALSTSGDTTNNKPAGIAADGTVYKMNYWMGGGSNTETFQQATDYGNTTTDNVFLNGGVLGIGTTHVPSGYLLAVNGTALFQKVRVKVYSEWPDYVFRDNYNLPSLTEVAKYIQENKHLPDVPSAEDMKKQGIDVADNQAMLLKKIEEMTLYIIDQDKKYQDQVVTLQGQQEEIANQNKKIEELNNEVKDLQSQNGQLKQLQSEVEQLKELLQKK